MKYCFGIMAPRPAVRGVHTMLITQAHKRYGLAEQLRMQEDVHVRVLSPFSCASEQLVIDALYGIGERHATFDLAFEGFGKSESGPEDDRVIDAIYLRAKSGSEALRAIRADLMLELVPPCDHYPPHFFVPVAHDFSPAAGMLAWSAAQDIDRKGEKDVQQRVNISFQAPNMTLFRQPEPDAPWSIYSHAPFTTSIAA